MSATNEIPTMHPTMRLRWYIAIHRYGQSGMITDESDPVLQQLWTTEDESVEDWRDVETVEEEV